MFRLMGISITVSVDFNSVASTQRRRRWRHGAGGWWPWRREEVLELCWIKELDKALVNHAGLVTSQSINGIAQRRCNGVHYRQAVEMASTSKESGRVGKTQVSTLTTTPRENKPTVLKSAHIFANGNIHPYLPPCEVNVLIEDATQRPAPNPPEKPDHNASAMLAYARGVQ